jgi:hypothetical protein
MISMGEDNCFTGWTSGGNHFFIQNLVRTNAGEKALLLGAGVNGAWIALWYAIISFLVRCFL